MRRLTCLALLLVILASACSPNSGPAKKGGTGGNNNSGPKGSPPPPCHPGCFPAGTLVETPSGSKAIETIVPGDEVTLIASDGNASVAKVRSVFQTGNRLVEVRTEAGTILTTQTQPFLLEDGGFRPAGKLTPGDVLWRWEIGQRHAARFESISHTERDAQVYNLVVGDSAVFIAGGYLVRGKPPLDVASK